MTGDAGVLALSWQDVEAILGRLAEEVRADAVPQRLIAVARGGLVPAVLLSHRLGVRQLDVVHAATTIDDRPNAEKVGVTLRLPADTGATDQSALIVEDIVGSGRTLRAVVAALANVGIRADVLACVVNERNWEASNATSDIGRDVRYIGQRARQWITFPWERR